MSTEDNKAIVRRYYEELWLGNAAIVDELMAPKSPHNTSSLEPSDLEGMKAWALNTRKLMPDITMKIEEMIAEGDKVMYRWMMRGTHTHVIPTPFGPANPTGKTITTTGIVINRIEAGQIVDNRFESDFLDYYQQLGVIPKPGQNS